VTHESPTAACGQRYGPGAIRSGEARFRGPSHLFRSLLPVRLRNIRPSSPSSRSLALHRPIPGQTSPTTVMPSSVFSTFPVRLDLNHAGRACRLLRPATQGLLSRHRRQGPATSALVCSNPSAAVRSVHRRSSPCSAQPRLCFRLAPSPPASAPRTASPSTSTHHQRPSQASISKSP
jgi:hypothetical protein